MAILYYNPTGDGGTTSWTPSSAGSHYVLVDEGRRPSTADHVSIGTATHTEEFTYSTPSSGDDIVSIQIFYYAGKDAFGGPNFKTWIDDPIGGDYTGTTHTPLNGIYGWFSETLTTDPVASGKWNWSTFQNYEWGMVSSASSFGTVYVATMYLKITTEEAVITYTPHAGI